MEDLMRYVTDVQLEEAIVHILNTEHANACVLSERALPLAASPQLVDYFTTHIVNGLRDPSARAASFVAITPANTAGICQALLDGTLDLVAGSRLLAERLYAIVSKDSRIKPGSLVVIRYRATSGSGPSEYLALMKVDPSRALHPVTERDDQGRLYVSFEVTPDVMPTTRERLQKCAFVRPLMPRAEFDMMLLDRQAGTQELQPVARFFSETFLGARLAFDARQRTHRFYLAAIGAQNELRPQLTPRQSDDLRQAINTAVTSDVLDVDAWIAALPLPQAQQDAVDAKITRSLPDREFEVDRDYANTLLRKRRFVGDYGLQVEVSADAFASVLKSVERIDEPGAPPRWRIIIETERWEEVVK
jgi:hypothetical protein